MLSPNFYFKKAKKEDFTWTARKGETKLWEDFNFGEPDSETEFVILGINEDIGPQMNFGNPGAKFGFKTTIEKLGHQASNHFLNGKGVCILGAVEQNIEFNKDFIGSSIIDELDQLVQETLKSYIKKSHRIIVVGGGHNNALPILRFYAQLHENQISVLNIDPHADCRSMENRHSGNPFSFAASEGILKNYHVLGLHEGYNNNTILDFLEKHKFTFQTFENFLDDPQLFENQFHEKTTGLDTNIGLEIDMDCIRFFPCSALTPSGFSIEEVRKFARAFSRIKKPLYLHLPEAAPSNLQEEHLSSKAIAYLITDFIKAVRL
ncbi:MAG: formimidoylglutamase [Bacteroidetes bacterium]|nr:formimidoylglutamase [Bacteroidota bacterium]